MNKLQLETVQWNSLNDIDELDPISDADYEVLSEIGDVIRKHNLANRFGICLLHRHFNIDEDERLIEVTDNENRMSIIRAEKISGTSENVIETMWRFKNGTESVTKCEKVCDKNFGHKRRHRKVAR